MTPELLAETLADHIDRLYRAAWALTASREDAEDLVQETYTRVLAKPRTIRAADEALPYLLGVLRNTYISTLRTRGRRPQTVPLEDTEHRMAAPASASPANVLETQELLTAISALSDDYRDAVIAVDVVGLSYQEAATVLSVPQGTIMSRLYRGRDRVAKAVGA